MGGGAKKAFGAGGRFWRAVNKVVDPLNIMDPMGVLPTSMIAGKKPFQFDKSFGKLQWNLGGGAIGGEAASGSQYNPAMMMYMSQMQNQQAQAAEAQRAQQEALAESQRQAGLTSAQQAQQESQQQISMQDALRQAQEAQTAQQQQEASQAAAQAQIGTGYDISRARQQQIANLAGGGLTSLPFYGYDSANAGVGATGRPSNVFNLPKTTDIKFGGQ